MDLTVIAQLENAGIDRAFQAHIPTIGVEVDDQRRVRAVSNDVVVNVGSITANVTLKEASHLFIGTKTPPSFRNGPTAEYERFFMVLESSVIEFCRSVGRAECDVEIERLFTHLRRRPDGVDANPLFSYLQAAARLYMSAFDVSQAQFDGVCRRLSQSAGRFSEGPTSTNYVEIVGSSLPSNSLQ